MDQILTFPLKIAQHFSSLLSISKSIWYPLAEYFACDPHPLVKFSPMEEETVESFHVILKAYFWKFVLCFFSFRNFLS